MADTVCVECRICGARFDSIPEIDFMVCPECEALERQSEVEAIAEERPWDVYTDSDELSDEEKRFDAKP